MYAVYYFVYLFFNTLYDLQAAQKGTVRSLHASAVRHQETVSNFSFIIITIKKFVFENRYTDIPTFYAENYMSYFFCIQFSTLVCRYQPTNDSISIQFIEQEGKTKCTLIPGDGVGPELVVSVQHVFKAAGVPVEFEPYFFSEVNPTLSAPLDQVSSSIARNRVCLKV